MKNCAWCDKEATYTFVGRTFQDEYKVVIVCKEHNIQLRKACAENNVQREKGMVKKFFSNLGE